jgi:glucan phosphoethanolaminetransferase (alkaline phosphatase superfamily)
MFSIAQDFEKLRPSNTTVLRYKYFVLFYYVAVISCVIFAIAMDRLTIGYQAALPAICMVLAACVYLIIKLRGVIQKRTGAEPIHVTVNEHLVRMYRTSILMCVFLVIVVMLGVINVTTSPRQVDRTVHGLSSVFFWLSVVITQLVIILFVHSTCTSYTSSSSSKKVLLPPRSKGSAQVAATLDNITLTAVVSV